MAHTDDHMPPRPGDVLRKRVMGNMQITQDQLAEALGVSRHSVNQLLNSRRAVTPEMALRLEQVLDTSAEMWLKLQAQVDLHETRRKIGDELGKLIRIRESGGRRSA